MNNRHGHDARKRRTLRRWAVHEAGCVLCNLRKYPEDMREFLIDVRLHGARVPRSLRRYLP